jgi:hypothetical protein
VSHGPWRLPPNTHENRPNHSGRPSAQNSLACIVAVRRNQSGRSMRILDSPLSPPPGLPTGMKYSVPAVPSPPTSYEYEYCGTRMLELLRSHSTRFLVVRRAYRPTRSIVTITASEYSTRIRKVPVHINLPGPDDVTSCYPRQVLL